MAFGISGFGGSQVTAYPQVFQSLSLGGSAPRLPQPPYGTPNQNLVPVLPSGAPAIRAILPPAAQPAFDAFLKLNGTSLL
ncbi:MAG: hypothetical protein JO199_01515, partial [Candidatus Eremiobacteraeota bacterium]|nr:hypothetical protein [Candidatus Eremiobacteraeota bacterium]